MSNENRDYPANETNQSGYGKCGGITAREKRRRQPQRETAPLKYDYDHGGRIQ